MLYLWIVSLIWAFSFSLIKGNLVGLDSNLVSFLRMAISFVVFLPFLRFKNLDFKLVLKLASIGMIQYGFMYISYIASYQYLKAWQIALFTIFTPIYVSIIADLFDRKFNLLSFLSALIAILGALVIKYKTGESDLFWKGFLLMQISNLAFAFGQVAYKKLMKKNKHISDYSIYAVIYFGALFITFLASLISVDFTSITISTKQVLTIVYLGSVASGLCFFLWNSGANKISISQLAIMNNMKIPTAIFVALVFFQEETNLVRLIIGSVILFFALFLDKFIGLILSKKS